MAEKTDAKVKYGLEDVEAVSAADFYPANVCPICFTQGSSEFNNEKHLEWHQKNVTG